ncbi:MAG TPA: alpha-2-macroglobulin family protein [Bacteroidales bacterium]|nr:alpha-2-macroglobulin family protein [Bacteroidales bacterium]
MLDTLKILATVPFFLAGLFLNAQQPGKPADYNTLWKNVQDAEEKGLPETALKTVNQIYSKAENDKNAAQLVKAVIHILKFSKYEDEDGFAKNIEKLESESRKAVFPAKPLIYSMLAETYWSYYQTNRYKFRNRTETKDFKNEDLSTWSLEMIVQKVIDNFQLSLTDADKLKNTKIDIYEEVLSAGNKKGRSYRPTLFDFLAHRALAFYMSDEPAIIKPAYAFTINSADYMADTETFTNLSITSKDSLAFKRYALLLFQDLMRFHLNDKTPEALLDVEYKRLQFVNQYLTLPNKQDLYLQALQKLEQKYSQNPASTIATFYMAQIWAERGRLYQPLQSEEHKWEIKKAYDLCTEARKRFPDSEGAAMAYNFQQELMTKEVSSQLEEVNVPGKPFRALVTYRNFSKLYWRIVAITREEVRAERKKWYRNYNVDLEEKFLSHFTPKTAVKSGEIQLPSDGDLQSHSTEIKLEDVPEGDYMVLLSNSPDFAINKNNLAYAFTTISSLSFINRNTDDGNTEIYVLNRTTGKPIEGASVQTYYRKYNSKLSTYETIKYLSFISNAEGFVSIPYMTIPDANYNNNSYAVDISWKNDKISSSKIDSYNEYDDANIWQHMKEKDYILSQTLFFLDRAIYRPGQTLYFKGLVFKTDGKNPEIMPKSKHTVTFYDVNSQVVAKKEVITNEYGTFSGTFTTPTSGITGQMRLEIDDTKNSSTYFSVEEYKRPKFEVTFNPVERSFRLGETIKATGKAVAYSGANIDGAQVKYRVVRMARFPYWWWYWRGYYPSSPQVEITNGTTTTDAEGKYSLDFTAIPDESIDKSSDPTFVYTLYADVTDINGETHSSSTSVSVGYKALALNVTIGNIDLADDKALSGKYNIGTTNLAGQFETAKGSITIWKLKSAEKSFRNRLWQQPDKYTMTQDEFKKLFPNDVYANEDNYLKWPKENEVAQIAFNTAENKEFTLKDLPSWKPGIYMLEITSKDKYGQDVKEVAYFDVFNSSSKDLAIPEMQHLTVLTPNREPGETAKIAIGSSEKVYAIFEVERDGKIINKQYVDLDNEKRSIEIPIIEEYRGDIAVHFTMIKDNRAYTQTATVHVPYTNKQLNISFETFRNKLQPGQEEQWKLKIAAAKADKIMAEMVATLYDASLDAFRANYWSANFYNSIYPRLSWNAQHGFTMQEFRNYNKNWNTYDHKSVASADYDALNWFGLSFYEWNRMYYEGEVLYDMVSKDGPVRSKSKRLAAPMAAMAEDADEAKLEEVVTVGYGTLKKEAAPAEPPAGNAGTQQETKTDFSDVKVRKNFNETAFFFPFLQTNENGEIIINFTIPEALTRWKMLGFAHTKDLKSGSITNELVTQKDLMIVPNQPRFFRENDKMTFSAKVTSLTDSALAGSARLEFFDALTMKPIDDLMANKNKQLNFQLKAKQSTNLEWSIEIPEGVQAITYRIVAKAGNFSDGEEMAIPVVTNRMLVTETMPLPIRGKQTKTFTLKKLANNASSTLKNQRFTLEFTSNPAWYAVQALPYLMEYPYECTEQTFSRFYANSIASHVANSNPKIKRVFDTWATIQPDALLSNLEKNQELKSALLEETPWVLNAKDESQRKRSVALLFDLNRMANEQEHALKKIKEAQTGNGGFSWFPGFPEDRYITQHIVAGLGHLDVMGVKSVRSDNSTWEMTEKTVRYIDEQMNDTYQRLKAEAKRGNLKLEDDHLGYTEIHYLYARSYFNDIVIQANYMEAFNYFAGQAKKYWLQNSIYMQGMIALALHRNNDKVTPAAIIKSLKERALNNEELGMYWKFDRGYYWYQAPIETQALMIEVFDEVAKDSKAVEDLKTWLLKQKQTQDWNTTKATSEACYALLRRGTDVLTTENSVEIKVGKETIDPATRPDIKTEAGTGYFKTAWTASEITNDMGKIQVTKKDDGVAWGAVYWQYFEQLDKITPAETPLKLKKQLFLQQNTDRGPVISPITESTVLNVGDLVKVRIELRTDQTMEYIHLKDMRAAGFEPVETLSRSKYQDGLYYYESPRDMATNFFIGWLPKGTYVFEYALRVSQKGDFSNGVTTIQCMYAPEFSGHSEGIRVKVK